MIHVFRPLGVPQTVKDRVQARNRGYGDATISVVGSVGDIDTQQL